AIHPRPVGARAARAARGRGRSRAAAGGDLGPHGRSAARAQRALPRAAAHGAAAAPGSPAVPVHARVRAQGARRPRHPARRAIGRRLTRTVTLRRRRRIIAPMRPLMVAALLALSLSLATTAHATESYALFRLDPLGIAPDIVEQLERILRGELGRVVGHELPSKRAVDDVARGSARLANCTADPSCLVPLSRALHRPPPLPA